MVLVGALIGLLLALLAVALWCPRLPFDDTASSDHDPADDEG